MITVIIETLLEEEGVKFIQYITVPDKEALQDLEICGEIIPDEEES